MADFSLSRSLRVNFSYTRDRSSTLSKNDRFSPLPIASVALGLTVWLDRLLDSVTQVSLKSEDFYLNRSLGRMRFVEELANFFCGFSAEG
jgi:hypothetical protein